MPTSLVSTGITFPDATTQTTAAVSGGGYALQNYVAPATWTKPAGLKAIKVTVVGAGGDGGTGGVPSPTGIGQGGGGGGGGTAIEFIPAPSIPGPVSVTAGPGTNSFGAFCSATAGSVGASTFATGNEGGDGGTGSGGNINIKGSGGGSSLRAVASVGPPATFFVTSGFGGSSSLGGGAKAVLNAPSTPSPTVGVNGGNYGGGGSGGLKTQPGSVGIAGGTGAPGIVIVEEFY